MIEDATSGSEISLIVLIAVSGIMVVLAAQVARYRGASTSETLRASGLGAGLGVAMWSFAPLVGLVALVVVSVFLAVWLNLFLLVRSFGS